MAGRFFFLSVNYFFQWGVFLKVDGLHHLDGVLVGEDGEVGLGLEEEYVAVLIVFPNALDAAASHGDAAFSVGEGEELVAGAREDGVGGLEGGEFGTVAEDDDGFGFALGGHTGDVVDGDEALFGAEEADFAVVHHAVVPALLDGEDAVLVVFVVAMLEAAGIEAFAAQLAVVVVGHEASLEATVDVVAGDVAFVADAFPPASVAVVVGPGGDFGGVAVAFVDDMDAVLDAHIVGGLLDEAAVFGVELPEAVAVALVVFAAGKEVTLSVVGLVEAAAAGLGIGVADAHSAIVVVVGEGAGLKAVLEVALIDLGAVLVGADPVTLAATLFVDLVLGGGTDGGEHHGCGKKENAFFHRLQLLLYNYCTLFIVIRMQARRLRTYYVTE